MPPEVCVGAGAGVERPGRPGASETNRQKGGDGVHSTPVAGAWRLSPRHHNEHVGMRYVMATLGEEEDLTLRQRARLREEFAEEFDRLPPHQEPSQGWAKTMAGLCRGIAHQLREQAEIEEPKPDKRKERELTRSRFY